MMQDRQILRKVMQIIHIKGLQGCKRKTMLFESGHIVILIYFWDRASLCVPDCPGTHSVNQAALDLRGLPLPPVLWLKVCATMPNGFVSFILFLPSYYRSLHLFCFQKSINSFPFQPSARVVSYHPVLRMEIIFSSLALKVISLTVARASCIVGHFLSLSHLSHQRLTHRPKFRKLPFPLNYWETKLVHV